MGTTTLYRLITNVALSAFATAADAAKSGEIRIQRMRRRTKFPNTAGPPDPASDAAGCGGGLRSRFPAQSRGIRSPNTYVRTILRPRQRLGRRAVPWQEENPRSRRCRLR